MLLLTNEVIIGLSPQHFWCDLSLLNSILVRISKLEVMRLYPAISKPFRPCMLNSSVFFPSPMKALNFFMGADDFPHWTVGLLVSLSLWLYHQGKIIPTSEIDTGRHELASLFPKITGSFTNLDTNEGSRPAGPLVGTGAINIPFRCFQLPRYPSLRGFRCSISMGGDMHLRRFSCIFCRVFLTQELVL